MPDRCMIRPRCRRRGGFLSPGLEAVTEQQQNMRPELLECRHDPCERGGSLAVDQERSRGSIRGQRRCDDPVDRQSFPVNAPSRRSAIWASSSSVSARVSAREPNTTATCKDDGFPRLAPELMDLTAKTGSQRGPEGMKKRPASPVCSAGSIVQVGAQLPKSAYCSTSAHLSRREGEGSQIGSAC